mmetsp:Transcript_20213/g.47856  ORF Transcript_20213/g.47856 Transcript_20213/m.47856 type:complete len:98 (-) Transcript_20213:581-874(-)
MLKTRMHRGFSWTTSAVIWRMFHGNCLAGRRPARPFLKSDYLATEIANHARRAVKPKLTQIRYSGLEPLLLPVGEARGPSSFNGSNLCAGIGSKFGL